MCSRRDMTKSDPISSLFNLKNDRLDNMRKSLLSCGYLMSSIWGTIYYKKSEPLGRAAGKFQPGLTCHDDEEEWDSWRFPWPCRIFLGRNAVMRKALGATKEDECRLGVHRIANVTFRLSSLLFGSQHWLRFPIRYATAAGRQCWIIIHEWGTQSSNRLVWIFQTSRLRSKW